MTYLTLYIKGAEIRVSLFLSPDGRGEAHAMIRATNGTHPFTVQLAAVEDAVSVVADQIKNVTGREMSLVFRRVFLSDPTNQIPLLDRKYDCAQSIVGQSPLDGTKVAQWLWLQEDGECREVEPNFWVNRYSQGWHGDSELLIEGSPAAVTERALVEMNKSLSRLGGNLADHCLRTWFVVRDVDSNYGGVVKGRNAVFNRLGLTSDTHFIASTGIGGFSPDPRQTVAFNSFSDLRVKGSEITYLKGSTHLNPTAEYGVAFERGTAVDYADRREVFISGTASIDNKGRIVAPGDIEAQTLRMLENIEVLLEEAECGFEDVAHLIVYLRDLADYKVVEEIFSNRLPEVPRVLVLAPVCRPGWLIETECIAIRKINGKSEIKY